MTGTISDQWSIVELWTPILIPIPTRINIRVNLQFAVCYSCCFAICYKHPRWDLSASPWINTCPLCQLPRYRFCSLFSFPRSGIPVIKSHCVWPDDGGYRNTKRALRISLLHRRSKSQSWAIKLLDILSHEPVSCRNSHPFTDDV